MTIDTNDILNSILESLSRIDYIHPEDIPNIDLYMDQVTTFMDTQLSSTKRYADDKILTKTMINNYAKNNLLPPPVKKKYSKDHLLLLIFIYYFKSILSIKDIETLLKPMTDAGFGQDSDKDTSSLADMYQQGIATALPEILTTIRFLFTFASSLITLSCAYGKPKEARSESSQS